VERSSADLVPCSPQPVELEPVKVSQLHPPLFGFNLVGPLAGGPFGVNFVLLPGFPHSTSRSAVREVDTELGEVKLVQPDPRSGYTTLRPINKSLRLIDDIDDGTQFPFVRAIGDIGNSAGFNKPLERHGGERT